jgi:hypothetical protein
MTLKLAQRILHINNDGFNQFTRSDGIYTMKLIKALLENMSCDVMMPTIIPLLLVQINICTGTIGDEYDKSPIDYTVSVLITLFMCFFNNASLSLDLIYKERSIEPVNWC